MMEKRPIVAITMGDPAGNGPEISIKALLHKELYEKVRPIIIGDARVIEKAKLFVGNPSVSINAVSCVKDAEFVFGNIDVLHEDILDDVDGFKVGVVSAQGGKAAFLSVKKAIKLAMNNEVDATCTNALNKEAMNLALEESNGSFSDGHTHFDGHTEIYATYTGTKSYAMMLVHGDLRVSHVSTHCALREACERVKKARVLEVIKLTYNALRLLGMKNPKIAVAGLNPHAGEHGLFGKEEIDEIIPAIKEANSLGINALGPIPPDSVFPEALGGWYDAVVAMYHDQGHIPVKVVGFVFDRDKQEWKAVEGVNVTLGLPIIRTSVDHGTGFALAGTGRSSELSLLNAIDFASMLARAR